MIVNIDYGMTEPHRERLLDNGGTFVGTGFNVAIEFLQIGGFVWAAATTFNLGEQVRPTIGNGRLYRCITAGVTGTTEPTFPTTPGGTVIDGTAEWEEFTPTVAWDVQAAGTVVITGQDQLPRDTSYRVRYVVTDMAAKTAPFPNKNRIDTWRVQDVMAG